MDGRSRHFFWNAPIYFNNSKDKNEFERNIILNQEIWISKSNDMVYPDIKTYLFISRIWYKNLIFNTKSEIWAYFFMKSWTKNEIFIQISRRREWLAKNFEFWSNFLEFLCLSILFLMIFYSRIQNWSFSNEFLHLISNFEAFLMISCN